MSETVGEAVVEVRGDVDRLRSDITAAGSTSGRGFASKFSGAMKGLGALAAGTLVAGFLKDAVVGASDLNETLSKTKVVFGGGADEVVRFASRGAAALGQTKQQALDAASTFGIFGKMAGLSGKDLAGFSTQFTTLSTDLASFHNASPEEAIQAIGAALRGEAEPIRRFGVLLDDATLRQEAMRLGLIKTTKEALTPQQKVLAAQASIMKQTKDAQGDFQRTSGGLANQQRILSATFTDMRTRLGAFLLPAVLAVVKGLNGLLNMAGRLKPVIDTVKNAIGGMFDAGGGESPFAGLMESVGPALSQVGAALGGFFKAMMPTLQSLGRSFTENVLPALASLGGLVTGQLLPAFARLLPVIQPVAEFLLKMFGQAVIGVIQGFIQAIRGVVQIVTGVFNLIRNLVTGNWQGVWDSLVQIVKGAVNLVVGILKVWWNGSILALFRRAGAFLVKGLWVTMWNALKNAGKAALSAIGRLVSAGLRAVGNFFKSAVTAYINFWRGLFTRLLSLASNGLSRARTFFSNFFNAARTIFSNIKSTIGRLIGDAVTGVVNAVKSLPGKITALGGRFLAAGKSIIGKFVDGLKNAGGVIQGIAGNVWQALRGLLNSAISKINAALSFTIDTPGPGGISINPPDIPHVAQGALSLPGGPVIVGERGRELLYAPRGSRVVGSAETERRLRGTGPAPVINVNLPTGDPEAAAAAVASRWVLAGLT